MRVLLGENGKDFIKSNGAVTEIELAEMNVPCYISLHIVRVPETFQTLPFR